MALNPLALTRFEAWASAGNQDGRSGRLGRLLWALIGAISEAAAPLPLVLFIAAGAPAAGADGSPGKPFPTFAAAIASSRFVDGASLWAAPGTYTETVTIPAARRNISIVGMGNVKLAPSAGQAIVYSPTGAYSASNLPLLRVQNVTLVGGAGLDGVVVDGSGLASTGAHVAIENVDDQTPDGSSLVGCNLIEVQQSRFTGRLAIRQSNRALVDGVTVDDTVSGLVLEYDASAAGIVSSHNGYVVQDSKLGKIGHNNEAKVFCDKGVTATDYAGSLSRDGNFVPGVTFHGTITNEMDLNSLPDTAGAAVAPVYDLRNAVISSLVVNSADTTGASIDAKGSTVSAFDGSGGAQAFTIYFNGGLLPPTLAIDNNTLVGRDLTVLRSFVIAASPAPGTPFAFNVGVLAGVPRWPTGVLLSFAVAQRSAVAAVADIVRFSNDSSVGFIVTSDAGTTVDIHISSVPGVV